MIEEKTALAWILQNQDEFWLFAERFREDQFKTEPWTRIWPQLLKGWKQHETFPTPEECDQVLNGLGLEVPTRTLAAELLRGAFTMSVSEYTRADIIKWLVTSEFINLGSMLLQTTQSKHDLQGQIEFYQTQLEGISLLLGERNIGIPFSPMDDPENWHQQLEEQFDSEPLPTPFARLNRKLRDGGMHPTLVLVVGPTGGGKTATTLTMSAHCSRLGLRSVNYALDDNPGELLERWYSLALRKPISYADARDVSKRAAIGKALRAQIAMEYPGLWQGYSLDPDKYSPRDILRHLHQVQHKFRLYDIAHNRRIKAERGPEELLIPDEQLGKIDLVTIDTADQVRATRHYRDNWMEQEKLFSELSAGPKMTKSPWICTVQGNQETVGATQITLRNVGGSYGKAKPAKLILGFAQTVAQSQQRATINHTSDYVKANLEHMFTYCPHNDKDVEWEPGYICIIKNTRASNIRGAGPVKNVMLPVLVDFSTCRMIENYEMPEELMRADKKTVAEEQVYHQNSGSSGGGKRGSK